MPHSVQPAHSVTVRVDAPAAVVFDFLADPIRLGRWSLGCMETRPTVVPGVFTGVSLYDGAQGWLSIEAHRPLLLIDYHVGTLERRTPRISARVVPGADAGLPDNACLATLTAWRTSAMSDDRWSRLCAAHDAEIWLIKAQVETGQRPVQDGGTGKGG